MKKPYSVIALALAGVLSLPLAGQPVFSAAVAAATNVPDFAQISPAAGMEMPEAPPSAPVTKKIIPVATTAPEIAPVQSSPAQSPVMPDISEMPPLRIGLDKPEIVTLDRDAINVIVGSNKNIRVVPDTNRTLVLIPKAPGSTYFRALDAEGKVIMQRHVIVGSPSANYLRIRRACASGDKNCQQYSVYYCPDMCHEVSVAQSNNDGSPTVPQDAPQYRPRQNNEDAGTAEGTGVSSGNPSGDTLQE